MAIGMATEVATMNGSQINNAEMPILVVVAKAVMRNVINCVKTCNAMASTVITMATSVMQATVTVNATVVIAILAAAMVDKAILEVTLVASAMLAAPNLMAAAIALASVAHAQAENTLVVVALEADANKKIISI